LSDELFRYCKASKLENSLAASKMRSQPAEFIHIILLCCFFPWKTPLFPKHMSFLIYNRKWMERFL